MRSAWRLATAERRFSRALQAVASTLVLAANLPDEFQLTHSEPNVITVVKMIKPTPVRVFSLGFRLDGSVSIIVGRGGDAPSGAQSSSRTTKMHITDEHESLLPDRPEGLTQHVDAVSSAVEGIVGHKPSHGETVVQRAILRRRGDGRARRRVAMTLRNHRHLYKKQTSTPYERSIK